MIHWQPNDGPFTIEEFGSNGMGLTWLGSRVYPFKLKLPAFNIRYPDKLLNILVTAGLTWALSHAVQSHYAAAAEAWLVMAAYEMFLHKFPSKWDLGANAVGAALAVWVMR